MRAVTIKPVRAWAIILRDARLRSEAGPQAPRGPLAIHASASIADADVQLVKTDRLATMVVDAGLTG